VRQPLVRFLSKPLVALAIVAAFAGFLRVYHLGRPGDRIFDEVYYSKDSCQYTGQYSIAGCGYNKDDRYWVVTAAHDRGEITWVHPQLGKWAIAAGILGAGNKPFGWRISSAAAGTAVAVMVAAIAWLLFGSVLWTYVAGILMATETLDFVQSRVSMLDIFEAFWIVLAILLLILDRRWIDRRTPESEPVPAPSETALSPGPGAMAVDESQPVPAPAPPEVHVPSPLWRPWRYAAGFAFGCAVATKWSAIPLLIAIIALAFFWEVGRRRRAGERHPLWRTFRMELLGVVLAFVVVPIAVYLISYTRYFVFQSWHSWWSMQKASWDFHSGLKYINDQGQHAHPYESKPWTWLPMFRPVSYYFQSPGTEILGMGHPLLFWGSILTIPAAAYSWLREKDWRAGLIVVAILAQYLPWFLGASRVEFLFYMTPVTPFLVLAAVYVLRDLSSRVGAGIAGRPYAPVAVAYVFAYLAVFAFFYPILTGWHLSYQAWHARMWMQSWI
jgi:dolichyl-phosphate-mannose-protein mannosyltransferase